MSDTTLACPHCDTHNIVRRTHKYHHTTDADWRCRECKSRFDEPVRRTSDRQNLDALTGLPRKLADMDPEEVPP